MKFYFEETRMLNGRHILKKEDGLIHRNMHNSDFSLMINGTYLGIDINSLDRRVYGISGYISLRGLQKSHVSIPSATKEGSLYLHNCELVSGTVQDYWIPSIAKYDQSQNCICLGDDARAAETIRISEDVLISINEGQIIAVFIMPSML